MWYEEAVVVGVSSDGRFEAGAVRKGPAFFRDWSRDCETPSSKSSRTATAT